MTENSPEAESTESKSEDNVKSPLDEVKEIKKEAELV